ncbi:hypothetical protein [Clostridium aciditolerans]|uniref:Gp5/Type VI secretion system Vgr protein OB-fold domain-containing protein n=1 Tax=Clostridium aciditolerans TaxID=339861 RepID=A0A934M1Y6_9CLOT|nr:hypothetical protein [Clostridium aciditolerans]
MGVLHALRVKSPYQLLRIEDIRIDNKPNEHGYLYLKCLIDDSINFQSVINASTSDKICIYEETEDENTSSKSPVNINVVKESKSKILFNGIVQNIKASNVNGVYYLEIQALTSSFELDIKEKSRSFQNANMTYDELIAIILKDYSGYSFTQCTAEGQTIGKPLFQYKETDWNFLKRIASELNSELFCDIMETRNMFYFGRPIKANYELEDIGFYKAHKNLKRFHEAGGIEAGHDTDYFYYEIERREKYEVGNNIRFKNKELYVNQYSAYALKDEVIYKYRLCRKNGIWQTKIYNSLLSGGSLEGKVLAVEGEKVKLNLDIDKEQNKEAAWFPYAPSTGNAMYSMPIVGTSARLYFPNESSEAPIVTGCVRKNGSSCAKTSDTTKRYFGTEHGSEIEMTPGAVNIKGGSKEPLSISFDDNVGVTLKSPKKLSLNADGEIIIKTPQSVNIKAQSQILAAKKGTQSGFSIENEFHFLGDNVIKNGSDREAYPPFDDEPKAGQKIEKKQEKKQEKKEEKKGFNWGKLAKNVLAGLAVVAVVAVAAVAIAATAVIAAVAVGAAVAGTAAVASQAISDVKRGEVSDMSAYMAAGGREAFVGAVSGAVFGPFGMGEALGGKMLLGGATNAFESIVRQTLEGKGINFKTALFDAGIGALTAGMFHGAGKLFEKSSPFVKNAFRKISSEVSDNMKIAKIALKNMEKRPKSVVLGSNFGNAAEGLGRFTKEFKEVKNGIKSGTKGAGNHNPLLRGDSELYSNMRPNGIPKSYISSEGNLIPANTEGIYKGRQVTVTEHILGGYRKGAKGNSPYTSFTFNKGIVEGYGNNLIELDISGLRKAIQSGEVTDVAILSPKQIERLIKNDKLQSDFWKKRALNWTKRDSEYLIRGEVPSEFIKIK